MKMGAMTAHNQTKTHSCDDFGVKFGLFEPQSERFVYVKGQNSGINVVKVHQNVRKRNNGLGKLGLVFFTGAYYAA